MSTEAKLDGRETSPIGGKTMFSPLVQNRLAFSVAEVAALVGQSRRAGWYFLANDALPVRRVGRKLRRVTRLDLIKWFRERGRDDLAVELERPVKAGPLVGLQLRMVDVAIALGTARPVVYWLERNAGLPVRRGHVCGVKPLVVVAALAEWLQSRPVYVPRVGATGRPPTTGAEVLQPAKPAIPSPTPEAEVVGEHQEPASAIDQTAEVAG